MEVPASSECVVVDSPLVRLPHITKITKLLTL